MNSDRKLQRHLSPLGAWAFAIGTSVGWGSLVVTSSTYLKQAGPMGSTLGLIIGALIMLLIGWNYAYLMKCYPEAGGAFVYSREAFGHDQGFLTAWFMAMTYFAILWANMTSLPLFARIFLGNIFRFGRLYTLFGYDVYLGEVLLSIAALVLIALLCMKWEKVMDKLMIVLALMFCAGIGVCFVGAVFGGGSGMLSPAYVPDSAALSQIIKIAVISPWAFIGFESISHGTEEFGFEHSKIRRVMLISVLSTLALYILVTLLSVTAYPARYASWLEYIRDLDSLDGLEALPAFYAASRYLGGFGVTALMLSLLALVITSLIGNMTALSRLFYSMARDSILVRCDGVKGTDIMDAILSLMPLDEFVDDPVHYADKQWTHVITPFDIPLWWPRYVSFDHGYTRPFSFGVWAVDPDGRVYRYKELYGCKPGEPNTGVCKTPYEIGDALADLLEDEFREGIHVEGVADPAIWDQSRGISVEEQIRTKFSGVVFRKGDNTRMDGKMQLHERLKFDEYGQPMLYVFSTCRDFIRTIPALAYDAKKVEDIDTAGEDHIYDETRYFLMSRPVAPRRAVEKPRKQYNPLE